MRFLARAAGAVFRVTGATDADVERRSWMLLAVAAVLLLQVGASALTIRHTGSGARTWIVAVPIGIPTLLAVVVLARRARADSAGLLLTGYALATLLVIAWAEGPGGNRMSLVILGIVAVGAVVSARLTALFGAALLAVVVGLALAQASGRYAPPELGPSQEPPYLPFVRQALTLGLMVYALRRSYDHLRGQVRDRERARELAIADAGELNASLERQVAERTAALGATRDHLSALADHLATDLTASLGALRHQLAELATAAAARDDGALPLVVRARNAADRLANMTERLHEHARLGSAALRPAVVDLDAIVREVIDDFPAPAGQPGVAWQVGALPAAWTDPTLARTVIENLLANAVKFSQARRSPRIEIGFDPARGYFVRDNGVGFDPRHAAALFAPFQRLHPEGEYDGYGIGLANVRRILHHLGGEIAADGEPDRGATFWFRLPPVDPVPP